MIFGRQLRHTLPFFRPKRNNDAILLLSHRQTMLDNSAKTKTKKEEDEDRLPDSTLHRDGAGEEEEVFLP